MAHSEGSFIRWQAITLTQLGQTTNLFLAFGGATLGFVLSTAKDPQSLAGCWRKGFLSAAALFLLLSLIFGGLCAINRLCDFRKTAQIAKHRERWERQAFATTWIADHLKARRLKVNKLGRRTWCFFCLQTIMLVVGVVFLIANYLAVYSSKLF